MTTAQKVIKYIAIALAIFIIVNIASALLFGLNMFSNFLGLTKEDNSTNRNTSNDIVSNFEDSQIMSLKIDLAYANLTVKTGDQFKSETNSKKIECKRSGNQLLIREKGLDWFSKDNNRNIVVTIPKDTLLDNVKIEAGAGEIQIEELNTKNLNLQMGAGKLTAQNLKVTQKSRIEGGAGKVEILSGSINNLDLEMGVGTFKLASILQGSNKIEAGIGKLDLDLTDDLENYTIRVERGIGAVKINGNEVSSDRTTLGTGATNIKVEGGIGSIDIY